MLLVVARQCSICNRCWILIQVDGFLFTNGQEIILKLSLDLIWPRTNNFKKADYVLHVGLLKLKNAVIVFFWSYIEHLKIESIFCCNFRLNSCLVLKSYNYWVTMKIHFLFIRYAFSSVLYGERSNFKTFFQSCLKPWNWYTNLFYSKEATDLFDIRCYICRFLYVIKVHFS